AHRAVNEPFPDDLAGQILSHELPPFGLCRTGAPTGARVTVGLSDHFLQPGEGLVETHGADLFGERPPAPGRHRVLRLIGEAEPAVAETDQPVLQIHRFRRTDLDGPAPLHQRAYIPREAKLAVDALPARELDAFAFAGCFPVKAGALRKIRIPLAKPQSYTPVARSHTITLCAFSPPSIREVLAMCYRQQEDA